MHPEVVGLYLYCYLVGAFPTALIIARLVKGIDLRKYGSGNVGGSNVIRNLGKGWFVPLAAIEFVLKGLSPVLLVYVLSDSAPGLYRESLLLVAAPLLALVGNNWSIFLRFQGGRGLMVICGTLLALVPLLFAFAISLYLAGWLITRSSAVWALAAVGITPALALAPGGYLLVDWAGILALLGGSGFPEIPAGYAGVISWYCGMIVAVVLLKRILSNSIRFPGNLPMRRVLFNRIFRDRDVDDRAEWVGRVPDRPGPERG